MRRGENHAKTFVISDDNSYTREYIGLRRIGGKEFFHLWSLWLTSKIGCTLGKKKNRNLFCFPFGLHYLWLMSKIGCTSTMKTKSHFLFCIVFGLHYLSSNKLRKHPRIRTLLLSLDLFDWIAKIMQKGRKSCENLCHLRWQFLYLKG